MTRFMISLSEDVKLIMIAGQNSYGGEVFVLKMPIMQLGDLAEVVVEGTRKKFNISLEDIKIRP